MLSSNNAGGEILLNGDGVLNGDCILKGDGSFNLGDGSFNLGDGCFNSGLSASLPQVILSGGMFVVTVCVSLLTFSD